jgi:hypothetical protein
MKTPWKKHGLSYADQEKRTASKPGARAQVNSGRTWSGLRDVKQRSPVAHVLIDNKTTDAQSYRIEKGDWLELKRDSNRTPPGCLPALQVDISGLALIVLEDGHYDAILEYIADLEGQLGNQRNSD